MNLPTDQSPDIGTSGAPADGQLTQLLVRYGSGDPQAQEALLPMVYAELRRLAASYMRRERQNHTLQATALVHEAYMRLIDQKSVEWKNRAHFFGVAAQMMRRILVDHARAALAEKRGGEQVRVSFEDDLVGAGAARNEDLLALDQALEELAKIDERQSRVVALRYFGGMSVEEVAVALNASPATIKRDWSVAKAFLHRRLQEGQETPGSPKG